MFSKFEQKIIQAIQEQNMLSVRYRKVGGEYDEKVVAPYDVYPKKNKNGYTRDCLLGCSEKFGQLRKGFLVYLDNIDSVSILSKSFLGMEVKRLLDNPRNNPNISRNW